MLAGHGGNISMAARASKLYFLNSFTEPRYRPYALALGQVNLAWNSLYSILALFFIVLHGEKVPPDVPLAVWNTSKSDRAQRDMLMAAAKSFLRIKNVAENFPTGFEDVKWLVAQIEKLEDVRNNIVHSPLAIQGRKNLILVVPDTSTGHPRALRLEETMSKRELLAEFKWCRDTALELRDYAWWMYANLCGEGPWPERPRMPVHRQAPNR